MWVLCGIGGSARILSRDYGFEVLGKSVSAKPRSRGKQLTPRRPALPFRPRKRVWSPRPASILAASVSFDAVGECWYVDPHMGAEQASAYADELLPRARRRKACCAVLLERCAYTRHAR